MPNPNFIEEFISNIKPGNRILDLGSGSGKYSRMFADKGALVTAVEVKPVVLVYESIASKQMTVADFIAEDNAQYDMVFMRNILQFLDKSWVFDTLFPWIDSHLQKGGIVGIETFYNNPKPPFDHPMNSLYTVQELVDHLQKWEEIFLKQYEQYRPDMAGKERKFYLSNLIVRNV